MDQSRHTQALSPPPPSLARAALSTIFFLNGVVLASWVPHIPTVKARHALGDGQLGLVLLSLAVGSIVALPLAGRLIGRFGSRRMTAIAAVGFCLAFPLPILSPTLGLLVLSLMLLGACNGTLDVSMNAQAVEVERRYRRAIMSSFHGLFSLGGLVGAGGAGLAMSWGVGDVQHVTLITFFSVCVVVSVLRWLASSAPEQEGRSPTFVKPTGVLLGLGILAFLGLLTEGAMADWSAVYLHDVLNTDSATTAAGFAACSLLMAAGRFGGDSLANRFGPQRLVRASGTLAAVGLGAGLLSGQPLTAILGFGLVGLGIANIIPVLFSIAGRIPGVPPGTALAAVATTGYCGFLAGPPLIGLAAELTNLPIALGLVSVSCALIAGSAGVVFRPLRVAHDTVGTPTQMGIIEYRGVAESGSEEALS
ncbi:MAG: MFS transporter [Deltaproteobacteria bacterium]|nr:MFS transporter [Deltaproteobacteria bacterium]